jgi:Na+/proline symporter
VQLVIGVILGRILVGAFFLRPYYQYKVYTVYDFLAIRFGPGDERVCVGAVSGDATLASGTRLFVHRW